MVHSRVIKFYQRTLLQSLTVLKILELEFKYLENPGVMLQLMLILVDDFLIKTFLISRFSY